MDHLVEGTAEKASTISAGCSKASSHAFLKGATNVMKKYGNGTSEIQIQVFYSHRQFSKDNGFKRPNHKYFIDQYYQAFLIAKESVKFESVLGSQTWPSKLLNVKIKLFCTSDFDKDQLSHNLNGLAIIPCLRGENYLHYADDAVRNFHNYIAYHMDKGKDS